MNTLAVRKTYECRATPDQVFDALTDEAAVTEWMSVDAEVDPRLGGEVTLRTGGCETITGTVIALERPVLVGFQWEVQGRTLTARLRLEPTADSTLVHLEEVGFDDDETLCGTRDYLWSHWLIRLAVLAPSG